MSFLAPLGFLFAASLPVILALYMLKLRRTRREVSSTMLWKKAADDLQANAPFQKLRRNLLMVMQLLIAALLVAGLARPFINLHTVSSRSVVLLIDNSASMGTRDESGGKSRLEAAKDQARDFVHAMPPGGMSMVVSFASKPTVLSQFSADKSRLDNLIGGIVQTDLPTEAHDAISLAQSLARPAQAEIRIFSDGAFATDGISLAPGIRCQFVSLGKASRNAGIVALDLRRPPENPKEFQVFATIRNYDDTASDAKLEVYSNGKLADVRPVHLDPKSESSQIFSNAQLAEGRVELRLDVKDTLDADNKAFAVISPPRKKRILLVSAGNYFLERVLRQDSSHSFEVVKALPGQYDPKDKADITIFDGTAPAGELAPGSYFFINAKPPIASFIEQGSEENPAIFDWNQQHPIMRFAELGDVQIQRAKKFKLPAASQVLAESRETPLISVYSSDNRNIVLWSFNIFESNFPLRVAFPILVSNALDWLLQNAPSSEGAVNATGQVLQIEAPQGLKRADITDPEKVTWELTPNAGGRLLFDRTSRAGFYKSELDGKPGPEFGVSLIDAKESDIAPRPSLELGSTTIAAAKTNAKANKEIWKWFAAAALAFVVLEWVIYHRRIWV